MKFSQFGKLNLRRKKYNTEKWFKEAAFKKEQLMK